MRRNFLVDIQSRRGSTAGRTRPYFPYGPTGVYWRSCVQYDVSAKVLSVPALQFMPAVYFSTVNLSSAIAFVDFDTT